VPRPSPGAAPIADSSSLNGLSLCVKCVCLVLIDVHVNKSICTHAYMHICIYTLWGRISTQIWTVIQIHARPGTVGVKEEEEEEEEEGGW
jgi:hypothetical protein